MKYITIKNKAIKHIAGLFGLFISIGIVFYLIQENDIANSLQIVKKTSLTHVIIMVLIYITTFYFRTVRWKLMLFNFTGINFMLLLKSIIWGFAGNNILPARGGEFMRMEYFCRGAKISRTTSLTSIGLEKFLDGIVLISFLFLASLFVTKKNEYLVQLIQIVSFIFFLVIAFLVVIRNKGKHILHWLELKNTKHSKFLIKYFLNFHAALSFFKTDTNTLKILICSVLIWFLEGLVFILGLNAIGLTNSIFLIGFIALCVVNFGILIPSSPGYIGVFQAAIILVLTSFDISETNSLAAAIIIHSCQFFPVTIIGIILFLNNSISKKNGQ